jgi:putative aldouronate transport system permease protein
MERCLFMVKQERTFFKTIVQHRILVLMALPAMLLTLLFAYIPMTGIVAAFKNLNYKQGIYFSPWVGLDNFRFFVISGKAVTITINTVVFNLIFIATSTVFSIIVAILVAEMTGRYFKKAMQSFMFLPFFISWVVASSFMYNIFNVDNGILNTFLESIQADPVNIYGEPWYWYIIMPIARLWKYTGYNSVLYLAAIMGISSEYYEAATIDGANRFMNIRHITLPLLKPTIVMLLLLSLGGILRGDFDMFYNLIGNNSLVYMKTDIIDTFVFRSLIKNPDVGMSSAAALYQSVVCFAFITITNQIIRKTNKEYALY